LFDKRHFGAMDWGIEMRVVFLIGAAAVALTLSACDAGPSATSKAPTQASANPGGVAAGSSASASSAASGVGRGASTDPRDAPVPVATDGKPLWAANRNHTAQENADYQFNKNGKDFGATSETEYVAKVHAFVDAPPTGVQKLERSNGDALLYDAKTNTFAVVTKTGAPRTMFKPRDGATYWQQQVARANERARSGDNSES
jgi:pyocin large subunit-like protein